MENSAVGSFEERHLRLEKLKRNISNGRKLNSEAAAEEKKKLSQHVKDEGKKKRLNPKDASQEEDFSNVTAEESLQWREKQKSKDKNGQTFGWEGMDNSAFKSYERNTRKLNFASPASNNEVVEESRLLSGSANGAVVSANALDRLTKDIEDSESRRRKYSRRRAHLDSGEVNYINEANANFNKRIKRAFDKFTVETRQNLERGTAI